MSPLRLFAIFLILVSASVGWMLLGGSIEFRTHDAGGKGFEQVGSLWGEPQYQQAPTFHAGKKAAAVESSDIAVDFELDQRRKGLLWYSTYAVSFDADYGVRNTSAEATKITMSFPFPSYAGIYDGFAVRVDGNAVPVTYVDGAAKATFDLAPGASTLVSTGYKTQGLDEWRYVATEGVGVIDDFSLVMRTDFDGYDFPEDGVSPTHKQAVDGGRELEWSYESLVSGRPIAIRMPKPINPGPVASRISFFAPVSLLFYFASLVLASSTRRVKIHPMNFAFLAAGFFAFHLLFAYLVDRIALGTAFAIASAVSVVLCVAYLRLAVSDRRTLVEAAAGQLIFLVLFSFSFFFEGYTGLAITIGAVLTLAYFMFKTARIDWGELFLEGKKAAALQAAPAVAPAVAPGVPSATAPAGAQEPPSPAPPAPGE